MNVGQKIKRNGDTYVVYKVQEFKIFAENEIGSIICIPNLKIIK